LEEKSTDKEAYYVVKKGKEMQRNMVTLWSDWLDSTTLVGELEAVTCQWQARKLTVFGTRMLTSGQFIVYKKATSLISFISGHYGAAARLLQIVLSLKSLVTLNHMKLVSMVDAIEK
jgi:intein-encoded DNA endonuclease-like protein